jgi:uncharacterized membrane protein
VELSTRAAAATPAKISLAQAILWLSVAALLAGIVFRFSQLGTKTLWGDETYTLLRVSGYTQGELDRIRDGRPHAIGDVRFFQRVHPEKSLRDNANSLALDEPQHPPLYFVAQRLWMQAFGNSVAVIRALPALAGAASLLAMFWLASELFPRSPTARWIAPALLAVSPFHVAYAHEAREYSLWAALTILTTAVMLRALRRPGFGWWALYAVGVVAGCYTDLLFAYVIAAHGLTLLCVRSTRTWRTLGSFCAAAGVGVLAFSPWLLAFYQHRAVLVYDIGWANNAMPLPIYLGKLAFNASAVFFDLTFVNTRYAIAGAAALAVAACALWVTARYAHALVKAVIFTMMLACAVPFIAGDALHHTFYATGTRYFVPVWIALELAVTFACALYIDWAGLPKVLRYVWVCAFAGLIALGTVSSAIGNRQPIWWDNHDDAASQPMAAAINAAGSAPLLLVNPGNVPRLLVMSRYLRDDARFEILTPASDPASVANVASVYALTPGTFMRGLLSRAHRCPLERVPLQSTTTTADELHADLAQLRGDAVDAIWKPSPPAGRACR